MTGIMRPTTLSPARHISRLCLRCEAQARGASFSSRATSLSKTTRASTFTSLPIATTSRQACFSNSPRTISENNSTETKASAAASSQPTSTHYDLFPETLPSGPPPAGHFPINTRLLRREFLRLQSLHHPDLHPASSKARAEGTSALINEAYKTLSNPLLRAQYLLSLQGVDVANDETLKVEEPDLLMLVLEAREEIEEADREEDLEEPRRINDERIRASEDLLDKAFARDDITAAKREAVRMRYWVNIKESLDNWEQGKPVILQH